MKTCPKCRTAKPLTEFYRCRTTKDGLQVWCKACNSAANERVRRSRGGLSAGERLAQRRAQAMASERKCSMCKHVLPRSEFYKASAAAAGITSQCKACKDRLNYQYLERRRSDPNRLAEYRATRSAYFRNYYRKSPEGRIRSDASHIVFLALRMGALQRQPCQVCGATKVQAHHTDYSKPLEVEWLCVKHHHAAHRSLTVL